MSQMQQVAIVKKRRPIWQWIVLALIVLVIISALSNAGKKTTTITTGTTPLATTAAVQAKPTDVPAVAAAPPTNTAAPQMARIGDGVDVGVWHVTVEKVARMKEFDWSGYKTMQTAKGEYELVYVTAQNTSGKTASINSFDYKLTDSTGAEYTSCAEFGCFAYPKTVKRDSFNTETPPRTQTKLLAIFDVAPDAKGLVLTIEGNTKILLVSK